MGVILNPKMVFIFPITCILALIFPILIKYFSKCGEKGSSGTISQFVSFIMVKLDLCTIEAKLELFTLKFVYKCKL